MVTNVSNNPLVRKVFLQFFIMIVLLVCIGSLAYAAPVKRAPVFNQAGVDFLSAEVFEMTNSYQNILSVTVTSPQAGYVVLTGSGYVSMSSPNDIGGWAAFSIGTVSSGSNNDNETAVAIPAGTGHGSIYNIPFSLTAVVPVAAGSNTFYLVGIRDPNSSFSSINAVSPKLTAIYIQNRM